MADRRFTLTEEQKRLHGADQHVRIFKGKSRPVGAIRAAWKKVQDA